MFTPQLLIVLGIVLVVLAIMGFVVYMLILHKLKAKLDSQLSVEYGKKRD